MPRRAGNVNDEDKEQELEELPQKAADSEDDVARLNRMLASVMKYISDDEITEIDIEYLLDKTEGLRKWWDESREKDRKKIENEIKKSLGSLSLGELERIKEQILSSGKES